MLIRSCARVGSRLCTEWESVARTGVAIMETEAVGRVTTEAKIENLEDLLAVKRGRLEPEQVRSVTVADALVDTAAMVLSLPTRFIQQLGLAPVLVKETLTAGGIRRTTMYEAVRLTVQDRFCTIDVLEVPDEVPVLIGQVPLEILDF